MKTPLAAEKRQMPSPLFAYFRKNEVNHVRDLILVEKDKRHNFRHAVGMPPQYIMLHTYGMLWTLGMFILPISKSRRRCIEPVEMDDILLTVGFNLRREDDTHSIQVPQGRHIERNKNALLNGQSSAVPAGLCGGVMHIIVRRLKPTINRVSSLRDLRTTIREIKFVH
jgi:hypothetical protein